MKNLTALSAAAVARPAPAYSTNTYEGPFRYTIGIVGNPTIPDVQWSDEQLSLIKAAGFNTLQLSIAWASKPAGEVLNLEDLDNPKNVKEWHRRVDQARKFGFRTLAQFGLPKGPQRDATTCILDPSVRQDCATRLRHFFEDFPEVDDVMIYTYDQLAWLCSQFGDCPRCHGIPLSKRLPGFLELMVDAVQEGNRGVRLWWEPWELSAGQTYAIVETIRPDHFGLIVHNTIAEVYFVNTTDHWVRNLARLARRRGIPMIGEAFLSGSGEDIAPLTHLACPRLVYEEADALRKTEGIVGIKEYYGLLPQRHCPNLELFTAYLTALDTPFQDLIRPVAAFYGPASTEHILEAWELTAQAMELFPWDGSWTLRGIFGRSEGQKWRAVPLASWITPSWQANRRAFFMVTDERQPYPHVPEDYGMTPPWRNECEERLFEHPWLLEDAGLRALAAGQRFDQAASLLNSAIHEASTGKQNLYAQKKDVIQAATASKYFGQQLLDSIHWSQ